MPPNFPSKSVVPFSSDAKEFNDSGKARIIQCQVVESTAICRGRGIGARGRGGPRPARMPLQQDTMAGGVVSRCRWEEALKSAKEYKGL